ncbi:MAG: phosphatidylglycerophosphatase A [Acidimicrobiia bacterium]|nr:phosphatidylglycerophosphatase A [Acidimicrobiia bacterium]
MRRVVASSFGLGFLPRLLWKTDSGAGTFGAGLAAVVGLVLWAHDAPWWVMLLLALVATAASLWSAVPFAVGGQDPGWVCMDETAGTFLALIGLTGWPWALALVVARLGDIYKVLPGVRRAERLPGALGVTADDLVAGLYGLAAGWLLAILR